MELDRRTFAKLLIAGSSLALGGCTDRSRYTQEEIDQLAAHRRRLGEREGRMGVADPSDDLAIVIEREIEVGV